MASSKKTPSLAETGERAVIRLIEKLFPAVQPDLVRGIGEDCAVISQQDDYLLVTTDTLVEGVHFRLDYTSPYLLGKKALAVNLSDIAAMGGIPAYAFLNLAAPPQLPLSFIRKLLQGINSWSKRYKVPLIGGDTVSSNGKIVLTITLIGRSPEKKAAFRSGAKEGDLVFVSGYLGDSAAGLTLLERNPAPQAEYKRLIKAHLDPTPRIELGRQLVQNNLINSMIDISDGLATDLAHVAEESGMGAEISSARVPISPSCRKLAKELNRSPMTWALSGGEDYEILFTVPKDKAGELPKISSRIFKIGRIVKKMGIYLIDNNEKKDISYTGFSHFSGSPQ